MISKNILVTGGASGLGSEVTTHFGGHQMGREELGHLIDTYDGEEFKAIFHCAFNSSKSVTTLSSEQYVYDNLFLTQKLLSLPCRKFFYISSQDIYPTNLDIKKEDSVFDVNLLQGAYQYTKYFSELAVKKCAKNYVICRPTTFLGMNIRPNTTSRLMTDDSPNLFLDSNSRFNYVLHRDVLYFLEIALQKDLQGIFNVATVGTVRLVDICNELGLTPSFGKYHYDVGNVDNLKISDVCPSFRKPVQVVLNEYIELLGQSFLGSGRLQEI